MNAISKQEEILTMPTKPSLTLRDISPKGGDKGAGAAVTAMITQMAQTMNQMQLVVASMAEMISATNRNVDDLRRQVQRMDKATPAQVGAIREAIRQRAAELCAAYGCEGCEKKVAAAIRKSIRIDTGAGSLKEICKDHVKPTLAQVATWDDFGIMCRMGVS